MEPDKRAGEDFYISPRTRGRLRWAVIALLLTFPIASVSHAAYGRAPTFLDADADGLDDALTPLLAQGGDLTVLLNLGAPATPDQVAAVEHAGAVVTFAAKHLPVLAARAPADRVPALARVPGVILVQENDALVPLLKQSVPMIGAPTVWKDLKVTGKGIVIAVLDDGVYEQHPDLSPKLAGHYDASAPSMPIASPVDVILPAGGEGHGTHVAGIVVGNGGESAGVYKGVAPDARIVNVRVFSAPNQTTSDIVIKGLDWTLDHMGQLKIRVAVMSLGGRATDSTDALSRSVNVAVSKGLVVVVAAGNRGPGNQTIGIPGVAANAITVGAVDKAGKLADYSSRGPTLDGRLKPDVVAPGTGITSTIPPASTTTVGKVLGGGDAAAIYYGPLTGTSMAAPHVAGLAALMLQANPDLTPEQVKQILVATAKDAGGPGADNLTGFGLVDAPSAVRVAKDPALLDDPRYAERLAALSGNVQPSLLDQAGLSFVSPTTLALAAGGIVVGLAAAGGAVWLVLRRKPGP